MNKVKKNNMNKNFIIIMLIILSITLIGIGYFIYDIIYMPADEEKPFDIKNEEVLATDENNLFALYDDDGLKIYNTKTSEINSINLENTYSDYRLYTTNDNKRLSAIIYKNGEYEEYYNVIANEKLLEEKYHYLDYRDENYIEGGIYIPERSDRRIDLINLSNQDVILSNTLNEKGYINNYYLKRFGSKYYFYSYCHCDVPGVNFYSEDGKYFLSSPHIGAYSFSNNGNLAIAKDGKISTYDIDGNLLNISENYNNILLLTDKYIIYINEEYEFNVNDIENNKNIKSFKLNNKYDYILYNMSDHEYNLTGCADQLYDGLNCPNSINYSFNLNTLTLTEK